MAKVHAIFSKSMIGVVSILILGSGILLRGTKSKTEFDKSQGKVIYLDTTFQELPFRHNGKMRYLQIDSYPKVFELFIGKEWGDFKPEFEQVDQLKVGDAITVYYDENSKEDDPRINRLAQFIDKDQKPYFIHGSRDQSIGFFVIITGIAIGLGLVYLKAKDKIK